jgi:methylenetetrahydrofolate dehydrogenase (NADP+)/methenyltetrahydrofolate cyclohydrolase
LFTCKEYVKDRKEFLKSRVASCNRAPKLCVIQIGDDPASNSYIKGKRKDCEEVGITFDHVHISDYENFTERDLRDLIIMKNYDSTVDGIIVQLPIPDKYSVSMVQSYISKEKDVDGFKKASYFTPCTPKGIIDYLECNNIELAGKECTVIGRSEIVGKPLVNLLIERGATVTCCNSKTRDISRFTTCSDIIISAIGRANYFDSSYFRMWLKDQIIIDVGINRDEDGKLCGDVQEEAKEMAKLATPVPNGVGLLTRVALLENTLLAYKLRGRE